MGTCQSQNARETTVEPLTIYPTKQTRYRVNMLQSKNKLNLLRLSLASPPPNISKKSAAYVLKLQDNETLPSPSEGTACTLPETPTSVASTSPMLTASNKFSFTPETGSNKTPKKSNLPFEQSKIDYDKYEDESYAKLKFSPLQSLMHFTSLELSIPEETDFNAPSDGEKPHYDQYKAKKSPTPTSEHNSMLMSAMVAASTTNSSLSSSLPHKLSSSSSRRHPSRSRRHHGHRSQHMGSMNNMKLRLRAEKKAPISILSLVAPPESAKDDAKRLKPSKSAIDRHALSDFHKIKLQAKLAAHAMRKQQRIQKLEDRFHDVMGYRELVKDFDSIQQYVDKMEPGDEGTPSIKGISFKESDSWYFDFQDIEIEDDFEDDKETNDEDDQSQSALSLLSTESMESQRVFYAGKRRQRRQRKKDREDQIQNNLLLLSGSTIDSQRQFFAEKQRARQGLEQSSRKKKHLQKKIQIDYGGNAAFVDTVGESGSMHNENESMILHAEDASFCSQLTEDDGYDYGVLRRRRQSDNLSACSTPTNDLGNSNQIASQKYYDGFTFGCDKENYTINSMHSHEKHGNAQKKILSPSLKEVVLSANIQTFTENIKAASTKAK